MATAGSYAFEISFNLHVLVDGRTHDVGSTYIGDARTDGYSTADVTVAAPDETVKSRVIILDSTVLVLDASTGKWDAHYGESPHFVDLRALFGLRSGVLDGLALTGQEMVDGVDTHRIEGSLRGLVIAGARGDFDVVYWIGAEDGLLREVFAYGQLELGDNTTLIGNINAEMASIKLTAKLFDQGKRVDIVTPTLAVPRFGHEAVLLDDGRVLVGGGFSGFANNNVIVEFPLGLVQVYEPAAGMWSIIEPLEGPGIFYSTTKLVDGRVLFVGLSGGDDQPVGMASIFDPVSESWTPLSGSSSPRGVPSLALLADGRVLVAGGLDYSGADSPYSSPEAVNVVEILDPLTGDWQQAAAMNRALQEQMLFSLNDGRVLAIGAMRNGSYDLTAHAEVYNPATDTWTLLSSQDPGFVPSDAINLLDGRLLVLGVPSRNEQQFHEARVYDPASDTWTLVGGMAHARPMAALVLLPDGRVLAAGGEYNWGEGFPSYSTSEIFDSATHSWSVGPDLSELRGNSSATLLRDGRLLLAGGIGLALDIEEVYPLDSIEIVDPGSPGMGAPAVTPASGCGPPAPILAPVHVPEPEAAPPPPRAVLSSANEAMQAVASYRLESALYITLEVAGKEERTIRKLDLDYQSPDRFRGRFCQSDPLGEFDFQFVRIGDVAYTFERESGEWVTGESPEVAVDFLDFLAEDIVSAMEEPYVDGLGIVNDSKVRFVHGTVKAAALGDTTLLPVLDIGDKGELRVVYWVGVDDSLVRRLIAKGEVEVPGVGKADLFIDVEFSGFGEVLVVEPATDGSSDTATR